MKENLRHKAKRRKRAQLRVFKENREAIFKAIMNVF